MAPTKEEKAAYARAWYLANRDKIKAARAEYAAANPEKIKAQKAAHYATHRDKIKAKVRAYKQANPEKVKASQAESQKKRAPQIRAYLEANAERISARGAAYYKANADERRTYSTAYRTANPEKVKTATAQWRRDNPEKVKAGQTVIRKRNAAGGALKRNGVTHAEVHGWSGGLCTICRAPDGSTKKAHPIDHCHATDKVRGLLCNRCNTALGLFKDDPALLAEAIRYLADPPEARRARGEAFTSSDD